MEILILSDYEDNFAKKLNMLCFENLLKNYVNEKHTIIHKNISDVNDILFYKKIIIFGEIKCNSLKFVENVVTLNKTNIYFVNIGIRANKYDKELICRLENIFNCKNVKYISVNYNDYIMNLCNIKVNGNMYVHY